MSAELFPSGQWVGFYIYSSRSKRYLMDLILEFDNGRITGEGHDGIGAFIILGTFNTESKECAWDKTYVGRHTVKYAGFRESKGIWGTWHIDRLSTGGFQIWPLSEGTALTATAEEETTTQPQTLPQAGSFWPVDITCRALTNRLYTSE